MHPRILDSSEVNWISHHTAQDDHLLFTTAMDCLNEYDDAFFVNTEEELEVMIEVWREIKAIKSRECGPPRTRELLESFVNCFYVISRRANFLTPHLSESLDELKDRLPLHLRSNVWTDKEYGSPRGQFSEQAGSSDTAVVPNEVESDTSSLQDYESDPGSSWAYRISDCPTWNGNAPPYQPEPKQRSMLVGETEYESSDKSDIESQHGKNQLRGSPARKRKADEMESD